MDQSPSFTRTFYFRDTFIAKQTVSSGEEPHYNIAYICPDCGDRWGRIFHSDEKKPLPRWHIEVRYCEIHMDVMWVAAVPGCFFNVHIYPYCYRNIPRAVLQHDFLMHMSLREHQIAAPKAVA